MDHGDIMKLAIAAILGILLGLEREMKRKPLGLKTCLVISVTSCLLTIVSIDSALFYNNFGGILRIDPTRITAQIVSGIGFLGAGVIMRKNNEVVSGLTTAAMVWASAGLGIAVGAGFYIDAVVGLLILLLSVEGLPFILKRIGPKVLREREVQVTLVIRQDVSIAEITNKINAVEIRIEKISSKQRQERTREVILLCVVDRFDQTIDFFDSLIKMENVLDLVVENL